MLPTRFSVLKLVRFDPPPSSLYPLPPSSLHAAVGTRTDNAALSCKCRYRPPPGNGIQTPHRRKDRPSCGHLTGLAPLPVLRLAPFRDDPLPSGEEDALPGGFIAPVAGVARKPEVGHGLPPEDQFQFVPGGNQWTPSCFASMAAVKDFLDRVREPLPCRHVYPGEDAGAPRTGLVRVRYHHRDGSISP